MKSNFRIGGVLKIHRVAPKARAPLFPWCLPIAVSRGNAELIHEDHNMIVDQGLDFFVGLVGGAYGTAPIAGMLPTNLLDYTVVKMDIRSGAVAAPAAGDTALSGTSEWIGHRDVGMGDSLMSVTYPATGQVEFSVLIPGPSLDGETLTEEGLLDDAGNLIARTTFSEDKTAAFGLQFDHLIQIERAP